MSPTDFKRLRNKLSLDARTRFILLFALFNTMFCLLVFLSLQIRQLTDDKQQLEDYVHVLVTRENRLEDLIQAQETRIAAGATQLAEFLFPKSSPTPFTPTPTLTTPPPVDTGYPKYLPGPTDIPPPLPPTSFPTSLPSPPPSPSATSVLPTPTLIPPSPTATPVPPTSVPTSVPPAPTPEDTETPTPTPTSTPTPTTPPPTLPPPVVLGISPNSGETGNTLSILELSGQYFQPGAIARIDNGLSSITLTPLAVVSSTLISGTLDLSVAAGGPWDVTVTNPDLKSGSASNLFTITIPITLTYGITTTCSISVTGCLNTTGAPDSSIADIEPNGMLTIDMGLGNGIRDGRGYDLVFYEWFNSNPAPGGVLQDFIVIELSEDGNNWYEIFNWGDGYNPPMDDFTNISTFSNDGDGEVDNEVIPSNILYGIPPNPPQATGILIDINLLGLSPNLSFRYLRFHCPAGGGDAAQVDSIERLH